MIIRPGFSSSDIRRQDLNVHCKKRLLMTNENEFIQVLLIFGYDETQVVLS